MPVEHPLGAGPHREGAQEEIQGLPDRVGVGIGTEVLRPLALGAPLDPRPGDLVGQGHGQPRVRLVVAVADVVAGPVLLDQVVLELEGLDLGLDEHPLQRGRGLDHGRGAGVQVPHRLEVAGGPLAQRDRLADIDHPPVPVAEQVHAGMVGNGLRLRPWAGRDAHRAILGRCGNSSVAAGSSSASAEQAYGECMRANYARRGQSVRRSGTNRYARQRNQPGGSPLGGCARARRLPVPNRSFLEPRRFRRALACRTPGSPPPAPRGRGRAGRDRRRGRGHPGRPRARRRRRPRRLGPAPRPAGRRAGRPRRPRPRATPRRPRRYAPGRPGRPCSASSRPGRPATPPPPTACSTRRAGSGTRRWPASSAPRPTGPWSRPCGSGASAPPGRPGPTSPSPSPTRRPSTRSPGWSPPGRSR